MLTLILITMHKLISVTVRRVLSRTKYPVNRAVQNIIGRDILNSAFILLIDVIVADKQEVKKHIAKRDISFAMCNDPTVSL